MARLNCVYCNKEITTRSREHVIQNALGGLYESEDICCPDCNNYISREIDAPFTKIFNPILGNIENLAKTNNKKSTPAYTGTISYNGKTYNDAFIKGDKIVGCASLSRELKCDISKLPLEIKSYNFEINNSSFKTGMAKIAFNYALAKDIDLGILQNGFAVAGKNGTITKIEYKYPVIPFCPTNPVDAYMELATPTELYHNMILFSQCNKLWCYIDLFNTFQYYVLLADNLPNGVKIYDNYMQTLQKLDRAEPQIKIFGPKDVMIYAQQYGVEPTMDQAELSRRIKNAIATKSQKQSMQGIISKKMSQMNIFAIMQTLKSHEQMRQIAHTVPLYFDEQNNLRTENFRTLSTNANGTQIITYPDSIMQLLESDKDMLARYTTAKFNKLNAFLLQKNQKTI